MELIGASQIVIVYDASAAGVCARTMRLVGRLNLESRLSINLWSFQELENDIGLSDRSMLQALAAETVIFAVSANAALPVRILKWLENWLPLKKRNEGALALLLDPEPSSAAEQLTICTLFRRMAQRARLDFFHNTSDWPQPHFEDRILIRPEAPTKHTATVPYFESPSTTTSSSSTTARSNPPPRRRIS